MANKSAQKANPTKKLALVMVAVFGAVGVILLAQSFASSQSYGAQAESASLSKDISYSDQTAAGGQAIQFQAEGCAGGDPFDQSVISEQLAYLASDELGGRQPGTPGDTATLTFISERFECLGLLPGGDNDTYLQGLTSGNRQTSNVVGYIPGNDPTVGDEIIVVGGHHDHLGTGNGGVLNGANDNGSGTVGVMAVAHAIKQQGPPRRTIAFVTFGDEEESYGGSNTFVNDSPSQLPRSNFVYMMNLDMIGTHFSQGGVSVYGAKTGDPARQAFDQYKDNYANLNYQSIGNNTGGSDNVAFDNANIRYIYFETDDSCWHKACDDEPRIEYPTYLSIIRLSSDIIEELANLDSL